MSLTAWILSSLGDIPCSVMVCPKKLFFFFLFVLQFFCIEPYVLCCSFEDLGHCNVMFLLILLFKKSSIILIASWIPEKVASNLHWKMSQDTVSLKGTCLNLYLFNGVVTL